MPDKDKLLNSLPVLDETEIETPPASGSPTAPSGGGAPAGGSLLDKLPMLEDVSQNVSRGTSGNLADTIAKHESEGMGGYQALPWRTDPKTGKKYLASSATGKYQFLWDTHGSDISRVTGVKSKQEFLDTPDAQEKFFDWHVQNNLEPAMHRIEKYNKAGYSDKQLEMLVHFKGEEGARKWLESRTDDTQKNNASIDDYIGAPEGRTLPQTMQAASGQGDNAAIHNDLQGATEVVRNLFMGGRGPVPIPKKEAKVDLPGSMNTLDFLSGKQPAPAPPPTAQNVEAARKTIQAEVKANTDYVNGFIAKNAEALSKYPGLTGNYTGMDTKKLDAATVSNRVTSPNGGTQDLANFTGASLNMMEERHKQEIANIESQFPEKLQIISAGAEMDRMYRPNQAEYDKAIAAANQRYKQEKDTFVGAVTNLANLKVANEFVNRKGPTAVVTDKDYLQIGMDVADAMGTPGISKVKNYANMGRLTQQEKLYYMGIGANALRYKTMQAAGDGQDAIAAGINKSTQNFENVAKRSNRQYLDAHPEIRKEQVVNAISDALFNDTKGASNPNVTEQTIKQYAEKLGIDPKDISDVKPEDIKREPNAVQSWIGGLNRSAGWMYEFGMRHGIAPAWNYLGGKAITGKEITEGGLDEHFPQNWYDSRGIGGSLLTGGPKPNASNMFAQATTVNSDKNSLSYLDNMVNPKAGNFQFNMNQIGHAVTGFVGEITGIAGVAGKAAKGAEALKLVSSVDKAEKLGTVVSTVIQSYDENMRAAREALPGSTAEDKGKQLTMGLLYTGLDVASELMFSSLDMRNRIFGRDNPFGQEIMDILRNEGADGLRYNNTAQKLMVKALERAGIDWAEQTGSEGAAELGKKIVDFAIAPEKFKNEDVKQDVWQATVQAGILSFLPSVAGGISHTQRDANLRKMLTTEVGSNARVYLDGIDKLVQTGQMDEATAEQKRATINTMAEVVANTPTASVLSGKELLPQQRVEYSNSLFNEQVAEQQKSATKDKVLQGQLDAYIKSEQKKREQILKDVDNGEVTVAQPTEQGTSATNITDEKGNNEAQTEGQKEGVLTENSSTEPGSAGAESGAPTVSIDNFDEVVANGAGRLEISSNGQKVPFKTFDVAIDAEGKTAEVVFVEKADPTQNKGVGYQAYVELGKRLAEQGITLQSQGQAQYAPGRALWDKLVKEGYATGSNGRYEFVNKDAVATEQQQQDAENTITVREMLDKPIMYKGKKAMLYQDGNAIVATFNDGTPEWEIGRADEVGEHPISEYGIGQQENVVSVNDAGNIVVRGKEYENRYSDPMMAINYSPDGERVSVTLHTSDGKPRTFKGDVAEDIAYQIHLKDLANKNETAEFERYINEDADVRDEIESARTDNEQSVADEQSGTGTESAAAVDNAGPESSAGEGQVANNEAVPGTEGEQAQVEPTPQSFAERIAAGEQLTSPEDLQYYENNKAAIEEILKKKAESEKPRQRKKAERKVNPAQADLFGRQPVSDPLFDFEPEPEHQQQESTPEEVTATTEPTAEAVPQPVQQQAAPAPVPQPAPVANNSNPADVLKTQRTPQEEAESAKVGDNIKQKFDNAEKVVGKRTVKVLENGQKIPGHYVLIDAFGVTPSNDPNSMRMSEGFPTLEDGRNPNDRDYTQPANEAKVRERANKYDGRAVENTPFVDKNGVVISGNDRTMSGQLAAKAGTDGEYYRTLKDKASDYGFTTEQVVDMKARNKNPRVIFVPDTIEPYTTQTFEKFNPKYTGKAKTPIEEAVQLGRTAPQSLIDGIGRQMEGHDRAAEFFADKTAVKNTLSLLEQAGIITSDNREAYYNSKNASFTTEGRELLQNLMLGKTFNEDTLRLLQNHADIREKMLFAMNNIMAIEAKGPKYSLKQHISEALHLWDQIENYRENVAQLPATEEGRERAYDQFMAQRSLFEETISAPAQIIWAEMNSKKKSSLRELTKSYLHSANEHSGGIDIFGNEPKNREELLQQYSQNKENERQLLIAAREAAGKGNEQPATEQVQRNEVPATESDAATTPSEREQPQPEGERPGQAAEGLALFEPEAAKEQPTTEQPAAEQPTTEQPAAAAPTEGKVDIAELKKKKEKDLTPEEKHELYLHAQKEFQKFDERITDKQQKVNELRDQVEALERADKTNTEEYKDLKKKLLGNERLLSDWKQQRAINNDVIRKYEKRRMGDALRDFSERNLGDNLVYSSPFAFVPKTVKGLLDLVAKGLDAGWNLRHAIRKAIAEYKAIDPEFRSKMEENPNNENITSNWLHSETVGMVNPEAVSNKPDLGSAKNKNLADAIIGKIKQGELTLDEAADKIFDNPNIPDETKLKLIDYLEYNTANEERLIHDKNNANFLDDYRPSYSEELRKFASGETYEDVFGQAPQGDQTYVVDKLHNMLADAEKMISLAQEHWGEKITDYGPKLLDYINKMSRDDGGTKKGSLLATYLGKLNEAKQKGEVEYGTINKLLEQAETSWQKYINQVGKELNTGRLLRLFRNKNLSELYADKIMAEKQIRSRNTISEELSSGKISEEVAMQGVLRPMEEVIAEEKARAAERAKTEADEQAHKAKRKKSEGKPNALFADKAAAKLKEIKDPNKLMNDIINKIKNTKC